MDPLEILESTADAGFASDEEGRIVAWNRPAERLLGYKAEQVLGKPCHQILCGMDVFGNRYCDEDCSVIKMIRRKEPVCSFELDLRKASGSLLRAVCSILVVRGPRSRQFTTIHLLQQAHPRPETEELLRRIRARAGDAPPAPMSDSAAVPAASPALTDRELEVLRMLAGGSSTPEVADSLFISVTTVRTHVQNILRKLDVHSKVQAVSFALRNRLI
jgi:PAS domain S-box-containing protein